MKLFRFILPILLVCCLAVGVSANDELTLFDEDAYSNMHAYNISVDGIYLDTSALPFSAYEVGGDDVTDLMVPLRLICESLGYMVSWDEASQLITVDDGVQVMTLKEGAMELSFTGKMGLTSLDRVMPLAFPVVIHNWYTYVPLSLFDCLFTETEVAYGVVNVNNLLTEN